MTSTEQELWRALRRLEEAVRGLAGPGPRPDLLERFAEIERWAKQLPADTHPSLRHYLDKKSYEKARQWLEDQAGGARPERGHA